MELLELAIYSFVIVTNTSGSSNSLPSTVFAHMQHSHTYNWGACDHITAVHTNRQH